MIKTKSFGYLNGGGKDASDKAIKFRNKCPMIIEEDGTAFPQIHHYSNNLFTKDPCTPSPMKVGTWIVVYKPKP